jgi:DNA replicative helicase MCM subunit Mcm2 (Cdc46/Mcm family)
MSEASSRPCAFCGRPEAPPTTSLFAGTTSGSTAENLACICNHCVEGFSAQLARTRTWGEHRALYRANAKAILAELEARAVGQLAARRALAAALFEHSLRPDGAALGRSPRVLLVGPRGTGKSTLLSAGVELSAWPAVRVDVGRLSEAGLAGDSAEMLVGSLDRAANEDHAMASLGAIFLDGLDLASRDRAASTQRELLRLLDGVACEVMTGPRGRWGKGYEIATKGVLMVAAVTAALPESAFVGPEALGAALVELGALEAFLARFDRLVALRPLGVDELGQIIERRANDAQRTLGEAASFRISEAALRVMAERAHRAPDGGWAAPRAVYALVERALHEAASGWVVSAEDALALACDPGEAR